VVTAKAGLAGLTRALATDLADHKVTVNLVAPGLVGRPEGGKTVPAQHAAHNTLTGERGRPEDVAGVVRFLCGPEARYITGQTIHVNGGAYLGESAAVSRPHRGRVHRHAAGAPHQKRLERDRVRRAERVSLGAQAEQAVAQPPLQRPEALPLQPIDRISGWMRLRDHAAGKLLAPVVVVTLRAGQIELSLAAFEQRAAARDDRLHARIVLFDRHPPRLARDEGR